MSPENLLKAMFARAVEVAQPAHVLAGFLPDPPKNRTIVIGAGKASAAMAAALEVNWPGPLEGLVLTRYGHGVPCERIEIAEGSHPVPDAAGTEASARILQLAHSAGPDDLVIALVSGGGSALLNLPPDGLSLDTMAELTSALLASGAPIDQLNCIRKHLSCINGGRLAAAASPARVLTLLVSDVPGDAPSDISSGPTVGDPTRVEDALKLLETLGLNLPTETFDALKSALNESVKPDDPRLANNETHVIAAPSASLNAACEIAEKAGFEVRNLGDQIEGEAREIGARMAREALALKARRTPGDKPIALISGGETTVTLPTDKLGVGTGGRNVDFLLGMAKVLEGAKGIYALACDTDGIDGGAEVAGALIEPDTLAKAKHHNISFEGAFQRFDGHGFFKAIDAQIITGPTHTNVNDFRTVLIYP